MNNLENWSNGKRPSWDEITHQNSLKLPLKSTDTIIDIPRFMGSWNVLANIPTSFEIGATNCIENYRFDEITNQIKIKFTYLPKDSKKISESLMRARIMNAPINSYWAMNVKLLGLYVPIDLSYLIVDIADDYSWTIIGVPDRSYCWIMIRDTITIDNYTQYDELFETLIDKAVYHGFDKSKFIKIPWKTIE